MDHFTVRSFYIPSASMRPTLQVNDYIVVDTRKWQPQRGEIVVFRSPQSSHKTDLVKRVVGVPGDTVEIRDGVVYVNGQPFELPSEEPPDSDFPPLEVPAGEFFVMGDNVNDSRDSRYIGNIPAENMVGKVKFIFLGPGAGTEFK